MTPREPRDMAASVRRRLDALAKKREEDFLMNAVRQRLKGFFAEPLDAIRNGEGFEKSWCVDGTGGWSSTV